MFWWCGRFFKCFVDDDDDDDKNDFLYKKEKILGGFGWGGFSVKGVVVVVVRVRWEKVWCERVEWGEDDIFKFVRRFIGIKKYVVGFLVDYKSMCRICWLIMLVDGSSGSYCFY